MSLARFSSAAKRWEETCMLWTIVVILLVLWVLGLTMKIASGLIHILLVIALIVVALRLFSGRRV
jgi:hypothetical protein